jgi:peroxiredoxin
MKSGAIRLAPYLVIILLIVEVVLLKQQNRELKSVVRAMASEAMEPLRPGDSVQAVGFQTMDGRRGELSYTDPGKKYLLFVLSTSCPHCERNLDLWSELVTFDGNRRCNIVGLRVDELQPTLDYASQKHLPFSLVSVAVDTGFHRNYRISGVPETILVGGNGRVQRTWPGELNSDQTSEIKNMINPEQSTYD